MLPIRETGWNIPQHLEAGPHLTLPDAASCFPSTPTIFFPSDLFPFFDGTPDAAAPPARPTLSLPNAAQHASHARSRRKGRQSKICTASGPRDRRMRLSIGVAQRFFQLQDMLGFDKASKTVQWLLTMSTAAIKELASVTSSSKICSSPGDQRSPKSESSTLTGSNNKCTPGTVSARKAKKASVNPTKKAASELHSVKARELRAKARERARERTTQKQKMMTSLHSLGGAKGESSLEDVKALLELANDKGEGNSSFASNYQCLNPVNNSSISGIVDEQYYFWDMDGFSGSYSSSMAAFTNSYSSSMVAFTNSYPNL